MVRRGDVLCGTATAGMSCSGGELEVNFCLSLEIE